MKKILVTGAAGFIGSHLTEALVEHGHQVKAFVRYNSAQSIGWLAHLPMTVAKHFEIRFGDIRDFDSVRQAMTDCDTVFHLAALIDVPYSYLNPKSYLETNVLGTYNVLQAARETGVAKVIQLSSSEVYGTAQFIPIHEKHPLNAQSPYAASKIGADQLALSFYRSFNLPVAIARPFNTYGPRQSVRAIIPSIITQIASGVDSIKVGNLHTIRDFNYVADTVSGLIAIAESSQTVGDVFNIGSGFDISIADLLDTITDLMQTNVKIVHELSRIRPEKSEVQELLANNMKIKQFTAWQPQYQGLDGLLQGLEKTIAWFTECQT